MLLPYKVLGLGTPLEILFLLFFALVFYVKQKLLVVQNIILPPVFELGESLLGCFDSEESDLFCANYVDDTMFPMCHNTYSLLLSKMIVMASIIFDVFASFLLKLSFLPSKTTFMFGINDFRTKNKMGCSYINNIWFVPIHCKAYGTVQCGVVSCYKYLGLITQQKGFNLDSAAKVKKTKSAVGELYGCLFKSKFSSYKHHRYYADVLLASNFFHVLVHGTTSCQKALEHLKKLITQCSAAQFDHKLRTSMLVTAL